MELLGYTVVAGLVLLETAKLVSRVSGCQCVSELLPLHPHRLLVAPSHDR